MGFLKTARFYATSAASGGKSSVLSTAELGLVSEISSEEWESWVSIVQRTKASDESLARLIDHGLILSDRKETKLQCYVKREHALRRACWAPDSAIRRYKIRADFERTSSAPVKFADTRDGLRAASEEFVAQHGAPPPAFYRIKGGKRIRLPSASTTPNTTILWDVLAARSTCRSFRLDQKLRQSELAPLLAHTFGAQGVTRWSEDFELLRRSSPSGGSLHPIEAFVLAIRVENIDPGFYHYDSRSHSLVRVSKSELSTSETQHLAVKLCSGQKWAGDAHVLVFLIARYDRSFWKYRQNRRAYDVVQMDAGHLSQTFYLIAAALKLGVFVSGALDFSAVEAILDLDDARRGAVCVLGCGFPSAQDELSLDRIAVSPPPER